MRHARAQRIDALLPSEEDVQEALGALYRHIASRGFNVCPRCGAKNAEPCKDTAGRILKPWQTHRERKGRKR